MSSTNSLRASAEDGLACLRVLVFWAATDTATALRVAVMAGFCAVSGDAGEAAGATDAITVCPAWLPITGSCGAAARLRLLLVADALVFSDGSAVFGETDKGMSSMERVLARFFGGGGNGIGSL